MKTLTWLLFAVILIFSVSKQNGELTYEHVSFAVMLLLVALAGDLREFDFWGLKGKNKLHALEELEGGPAVTGQSKPVSKKALDEAEQATPPTQLMDNDQGNFLALAFEIERLLRIFATVSLIKDIPSNTNLKSLTKELRKADLLTDLGVKQVEAIRWVRNLLTHGRQNEINLETLRTGTDIALDLYRELYEQIYHEPPPV